MDDQGNIRELADGEMPGDNEIAIDNAIAGELRRLSVGQRRRFYQSIKHGDNESAALVKARSQP